MVSSKEKENGLWMYYLLIMYYIIINYFNYLFNYEYIMWNRLTFQKWSSIPGEVYKIK